MEEKTSVEIKELEEKLKSLKDKNKVPVLELTKVNETLNQGIRKDGRKYSVRTNRDRFFYPNEWMKFFDDLTKNSQKLTFDFLINTGARINEARNVKAGDIDFENKRLILRITKVRAKKKEKNPRPRTISFSTEFGKRLKKYIKDKKNDEFIGVLSTPAANIAMRNHLKKIKIEDFYMFSLHNIRKTHGNWLKALGIDGAEICTRLGHDYNTFLKSYSSPDIFSFEERSKMRLVLGDLLQR